MQVLLTAFKNTSSEILVKSIKTYDRLVLENDKIRSVKQLEEKTQKENYRYIFSFGQRPLIKNKLHIESSAEISGEVLETEFNAEKLKKAFEDCGAAVMLSHYAGTSYCNNIYFYGMKMIAERCSNAEMIFIHIPYMKNISNYAEFFKSMENGINNFLSEEQ